MALNPELLKELMKGDELLDMPVLGLGSSGFMDAILTSSRRWGKTADLVVFDEWSTPGNFTVRKELQDGEVVFTYHDPRYPAADTEVRQKVIDKRDPRNPNPNAPPARHYVIAVAGRVSAQTYPAVQLAKGQAEHVHKTLVSRIIEEEQRHNPNFGRFA